MKPGSRVLPQAVETHVTVSHITMVTAVDVNTVSSRTALLDKTPLRGVVHRSSL